LGLDSFLGFTKEDTQLFGKGDEYIPQIIKNHRKDYKKKILDNVKKKDVEKPENFGKAAKRK